MVYTYYTVDIGVPEPSSAVSNSCQHIDAGPFTSI